MANKDAQNAVDPNVKKGCLVIFGVMVCMAFCIAGLSDPEKSGSPRASSSNPELTERLRAESEDYVAELSGSNRSDDPGQRPGTWNMINFVDEFGDVTDKGAVSQKVKSDNPMGFPYGDVWAQLFVDCNRAWIRFSQAPNIPGGEIHDGYTNHSVTVRVDGARERWGVRQSWGDQDLSFRNSGRVVSALSSGSEFAVAVPWYGQDAPVFSWSLRGSTAAIKKSCD